jgi:UDPglucose 6-dehydrogenase
LKLAGGGCDAEIVFICVGTPQDKDGSADLSYVKAAAAEIGKNLNGYKVIVTKSTVPVGTNEMVKKTVLHNLPAPVEFDVASNPEFLREGTSVEDMRAPDRTVVGSDSVKALEILKKLYSHLDAPIVACDLRSAELIKYAANSFLATKITFINEISQLCERMNADVKMVAYGMGLDKRIGPKFLNAGPGYGGSCFPKDVSALYKSSMDYGFAFRILKGVIDANEVQRESFIKKVTHVFGENLSGKTFACLGLSFKNNTDDVRESVAIKIVRALRGMGAAIKVFDPQAMETGLKALGGQGIEYALSMNDAAKGADAMCILTEWDEFKSLDLDFVEKNSNVKVVFDGRNLLDAGQVKSHGMAYYGTGKILN